MDIYAIRKSDGKEVRIGTGENLYQIRWEDRLHVSPRPEGGNLWRLPYNDEDHVAPGDYEQRIRDYVLKDFIIKDAELYVGNCQLYHKSGLTIGVICYHGIKLPERVGDYLPTWFNKEPWDFALSAVKNTENGIKGVVRCRWCRKLWIVDIHDILPFIPELDFKTRLRIYAEYNDR